MRHGRDGDEFDQFAVSRWSMALRLAHRLTGDASTAEDLAQEALARMWSRWDRLERDHLDADLRRTVTNLFYSQVLRRTRYEQIIRLLPWPKSLTETDRGVEERDELATALLRLPPRQRTARHARVRPCWPVGADRDADPGDHYSQCPTGRPRRGRLRPRRPVRPTGPWGRRGAFFFGCSGEGRQELTVARLRTVGPEGRSATGCARRCSRTWRVRHGSSVVPATVRSSVRTRRASSTASAWTRPACGHRPGPRGGRLLVHDVGAGPPDRRAVVRDRLPVRRAH